MHKLITKGLAIVALHLTTSSWAADHEVTIDGLSFVPEQLTIAVGDTVTWKWSTGIPHNVVADDESFTSGAISTEGNFKQTFNAAGEVPYHCAPHRNQGMTGLITVEDSAPAVFINSGMNDAWWDARCAAGDPDCVNGQGFLMAVYPENMLVFLAWFTFDTERPPEDVEALLGDPGHRWFTAVGAYEPGDSVSMQIELTQGLVFDSTDPPYSPDKQTFVGTMDISFADCSNATLTYDFPDQEIEGLIDLTRTAPDPANVQLCNDLSAELQAAQ